MRMWNVPVETMCRQHLLGEHNEMHMFAGSIAKGIRINGYVRRGYVDTTLIQERHDELAAELLRRGYNHNSPLQYTDTLGLGYVSITQSFEELHNRCLDCKLRAVGWSVLDPMDTLVV